MVMTPLRVRQKDGLDVGAAVVYAGEPIFSPELVSAMAGTKGAVTGAG